MAAFKGVLAIALLAAAVLATPAPAAAATKRPLPNCAAKKSETLLATKAARVYALRDDPSADAEIYACNYRKNRRVLLGYESECLNSDHVKGVRLAGRYVGYVTETCEIESENSTYDIQAVDLISGKTRRRAIAPSIADFEMSRTGSLVWFGWRTEGAGFEVRKLEPGSPAGGTLVDPGPDVAIGSLGLTNKGDGFYWRRGNDTPVRSAAMRAAALLVGAVVAVAAAPPAADAAQRNPLRDCGAKKSRTLAASKEARVYLIPSRDTVYACAYRSNRRLEIGAAAECAAPRVSDFRFGDGVLAFVEHSCTLDFGRRGIRVIDLKTLRTKRKVTAITASFADDYSTDIESWALKRNGSIAWIGRVFASPTTDNPSALTPRYQVWKAGTGDPAGGTMLDSGDDVEPESLGLSDGGRGPSDVYWRKGATPQSATLR